MQCFLTSEFIKMKSDLTLGMSDKSRPKPAYNHGRNAWNEGSLNSHNVAEGNRKREQARTSHEIRSNQAPQEASPPFLLRLLPTLHRKKSV